jgi:uncharacterized protein DUF6941
VRVDYAFIAEVADAQNHFFYVTRGGADIHMAPRTAPKPFRIDALSFVVGIVGEPHEVGRDLPLAWTIVDADGRPSVRQDGVIRFEQHPIDPTRTKTNVMALRFFGFLVPDFGTYLFEVHHDDERLTQVPFWVVPVDQAPPAPV